MKILTRITMLSAVAVISLLNTSCKKYLDEKANKLQVVPKTINDLQGLLDDDFTMNTKVPGFGEASSDNFFLTTANYNANALRERQTYTWTIREYNYPNDWADAYFPVYNANYCLDNIGAIQKTTGNESQWDNVYGSAHFFRAYYFAELLWVFAKAYDETTSSTDPGIVLRMTSDFNVPSFRTNVRACYSAVIEDLMQAAAMLPDQPGNVFRPSKAAAYAVLAKTYLSMRRYDSAYKYADLSFTLKNDVLDFNGSDVDLTSQVPFRPYNREIVFFTTRTSNFGILFAPYAYCDTTLYNSYNSHDLRKAAFYYPEAGYHCFKGQYSADLNRFFTGISVGEVLLMRAECLARLNRINDAMNDINRLLVKRWENGFFVPMTAANQSQALDIILTERRKELTSRGVRWMDIKRLNKENADLVLTRKIDGQVLQLSPNDNRYAIPLPKDIIDQTGMQQNE